MKTQKRAAGRKAAKEDREKREIEVGCHYIAPRVYWAVWTVGSSAPPCIAGTKIDAEDLRDDDEIALPLAVASPLWLQDVAGQLEIAQNRLYDEWKRLGGRMGDPLHSVAEILLAVQLNIERGVGKAPVYLTKAKP